MLARPWFAFLGGMLAATAVQSAAPPPASATLQRVAAFPHQQVTGVAVSREGRVFVNFPFWADGHTLSVAELGANGEPRPFPDEAWNRKTADPVQRFVCVQSVYVDDTDALWIVDAGSPKMTGVVPGGAKLLRVDLATNRIAQTIRFDEKTAPESSYLNDVRVDTRHGFAFLTDSGLGALVVVDLKSGAARRVLAGHASVQAEPGLRITVEGVTLIDPDKQQPVAIASDGIALDAGGGHLYYKALTGRALHRIALAELERADASDTELAARVEALGPAPVCDGLEFHDGALFITAIEDNAIVRFDPASRSSAVFVRDEKLKWPDSLAFAPDGSLYVTTSQIHLTPRFNGGATRVKEPFSVFRVAARSR